MQRHEDGTSSLEVLGGSLSCYHKHAFPMASLRHFSRNVKCITRLHSVIKDVNMLDVGCKLSHLH